jgi:hypothetical protein
MDVEARDRLLARLGDVNDFDRPRPLVGLEDYFEGNDDPGSIGYNLPGEQTGPAEIYALLRPIRDRDDVADVLIEIKDLEDPDGWPASDTIWLIVGIGVSVATVRSWFPDDLAPDEMYDSLDPSWSNDPVDPPYDPAPGTRAVQAWYD